MRPELASPRRARVQPGRSRPGQQRSGPGQQQQEPGWPPPVAPATMRRPSASPRRPRRRGLGRPRPVGPRQLALPGRGQRRSVLQPPERPLQHRQRHLQQRRSARLRQLARPWRRPSSPGPSWRRPSSRPWALRAARGVSARHARRVSSPCRRRPRPVMPTDPSRQHRVSSRGRGPPRSSSRTLSRARGS